MPAIDGDDATRHEARRITRQKQQRAIQIIEPSQSSLRNPGNKRFASVALEKSLIEVGGKIARGEHVHPDPVTREFERHLFGQLDHPSLGNGIGRNMSALPQAQHRRNVDDRPPP